MNHNPVHAVPPAATDSPSQAEPRGPAAGLWSRRVRRLRGEEGSVASELAVVAPLLILVLSFIVLVGRLTQLQLQVESAAHQAARSASQQATLAAAEQAATRIAAELGTRCDTPTATLTTAQWAPGGTVTVTLTCHAVVADLTLLPISSHITVSASFTSPIDRFAPGRS